MARLLYIEASPLKALSHSIDVARTFLDAYTMKNPEDKIESLDLWDASLPPFDGKTIEAKFAVLRKKEFTAEQLARWEAVRAVSRRFNLADKYVFSVPMWNFSIPYPLKHYIDVVTLPGENWAWSRAGGYQTLLSGKKAVLIYASAGDYAAGGPNLDSDFQKPYLRRWLRFIGVTDIREIDIAPTLTDADNLAETKRDAKLEAAAMAADY